MESERDNISFFKILKTAMPMVFKSCPILVMCIIVVNILHGVSLGVNTLAIQKFFDSITQVSKGEVTIKMALIMLGLLGIALVVNQILNGIANFLPGNVLQNKAVGILGKALNDKSSRLSAIDFENPLVLDDINKAQQGLESSVFVSIRIVSMVTFYLPYFIFMGIYLYKLKPILAISLILVFIPVVLSQLIRIKLFTNLEDKVAPIRREYEYYERCIIDREYFKETRLLGGFSYFGSLYKDALGFMNREIWKIEKKTGLVELGMKFITLLGYMGILALLAQALLDKSISVGAFGAVFTSIGFMFKIMEEIICRHIGRIAQRLGTVKNFIRFLEMPERKGEDIEIEGTPSIEMKNVGFIYPGANKFSLKNINLNIKSKETIAIVGENGAGKSTLVRMMVGMYTPSEGKVSINNVDAKRISTKSLYEGISAVFQKFQKYNMTLGENISISNENYDINESMLEEAITKADLEVSKEKFEEGYNTMLAREFDGIDLSGGQWQRVAIARGFYRNHNMIVLDEPTAAIDPIEETKIYKKFQQMSQGKTSIIVTHRLGSAKIADRIVVMDKGKIVQVGSHDELINVHGKYSEMYEAQSKWYSELIK
ncbi:MAG: ABC transporter ATP-binding protein [Clostridium sp.]|uniref:ABC transporter ATP-binding protein n=1 Tax=Clostridium sp. TaxID=1506 RepID=UPI003D6D0E2D